MNDLRTALAQTIINRVREQATDTSDQRTIADIIAGVQKSVDNHPARKNTTPIARQMEAARMAGLEAGRIERVSRRKKAALSRQHRRDQIEALSTSPDPLPLERIAPAWLIVELMVPIIERIARSKKRRLQRYLGDLTADVETEATEDMLNVIARSTQDLDVLLESAGRLASDAPVALPADADTDARKRHKAVRRGCGWLMGVANNVVMRAIDTAYRSDENLRWASLDIIAAVMDQASGPQEDVFYSRFKADRAPVMMGSRWHNPGSVDPGLVSMALAAAITDRRLDPLVEMFLDQENCHPNGTFRWEQNAYKVFTLSPGDGAWMWALVEKRTSGFSYPEKARASMAKTWTNRLFAWLPSFMVDIVDVLQDMPFGDGKRYPLVPSLSFYTVEEAADAIASVLES